MDGANEGKPMTLKDLTKELMEWNKDPMTLAKAIFEVLKEQNIAISALDLVGCLRCHAGYQELSRDEISSILSNLQYEQKEIYNACCRVFPTKFTVLANLPWQSTGIYFNFGEVVVIRYLSGRWYFNPAERPCGPEGSRYTAKDGYALPGEREGALIGKIGETKFCVNQSFGTIVLEKGESQELQFSINDDISDIYGLGLRDNSGTMEVEVEIFMN